jgi:predicted house-cleaning noncanonical NTP pyrophosphatase (MazG superfamily)
LVRDSIPGHIKRHGEQVRLAKIGRGEARAALLVKLMEEIQEVKAAQSPDEVKAEIADVHEVVRSLCAATGIEWAEVENIAEEKRAKRGSFQENVVLLETSWPTSAYSEDSPTRLIPLRNLAQTTVSGDTVHLSYAALFADGADATIVLQSGGRIKISLDEVGVRIVELPEEELNESQLKLPF